MPRRRISNIKGEGRRDSVECEEGERRRGVIFCFNFSFLLMSGLVNVCSRFDFMILDEIKFDILLNELNKAN